MKNVQFKGLLERNPVSDLKRKTLSQIPSTFGRLRYLSSLRDANSGLYEHHGLTIMFGEGPADRALRGCHTESFREWLGFTLEQQKADLDLYLCNIDVELASVIETWCRLEPYRNLIPVSADPVERQLYLAEFKIMLEMLKNEYGVFCPDPVA